MRGFLRQDTRKGIRNHVLVAFLVECARHVAEEIVEDYRNSGVELIGFPSCYPSAYGADMLKALTTHPNVGAALLISLGCESFRAGALESAVVSSGRLGKILTIQRDGGTRGTIAAGKSWVENALGSLDRASPEALGMQELVIGILPAGAGAESARALGRLSDQLVEAGSTIVFEDPGKGRDLIARGATPAISRGIEHMAQRAVYCRRLFDNDTSGSDFSYHAIGESLISGLLRPGMRPPAPGLYLLDSVPLGEPRYGPIDLGPVISAGELAACGAQILVAAGEGDAITGTAVAPLVTVSADQGSGGDAVDASDGASAFQAVISAAEGQATAAERFGNPDFALVHKSFEPALASP